MPELHEAQRYVGIVGILGTALHSRRILQALG